MILDVCNTEGTFEVDSFAIDKFRGIKMFRDQLYFVLNLIRRPLTLNKKLVNIRLLYRQGITETKSTTLYRVRIMYWYCKWKL